ncbi:MAG: tRNA (adenosine(37)-N6)-threonylcarbamoyltransferase complex ATPase subunit type 1 TsaE [Verrucomicrobia bacterium]|nr:tRNA (adenosine(37)-N6)-threonylcarbamoyltransferase complex ATPase subunit type 1 TsaE [Verrucomicrobiota bacterium]
MKQATANSIICRADCKTPESRKIDDFKAVCEGSDSYPCTDDETIPERVGEESGAQNASKGRFFCEPEFCNRLYTKSAEETLAFAKEFGSNLPQKTTIAFSGELGAGKTTFIRGLVEGAAQIDPRQVSSPTFSFLHIYEGSKKIYHFDLYRLPNEREFISSGFDDFINADGICCIEWAERIPSFLPKDCLKIHIAHAGEGSRTIEITQGERS